VVLPLPKGEGGRISGGEFWGIYDYAINGRIPEYTKMFIRLVAMMCRDLITIFVILEW